MSANPSNFRKRILLHLLRSVVGTSRRRVIVWFRGTAASDFEYLRRGLPATAAQPRTARRKRRMLALLSN